MHRTAIAAAFAWGSGAGLCDERRRPLRADGGGGGLSPLLLEPDVAHSHPVALTVRPDASAADATAAATPGPIAGRRGIQAVAEARRALPAPNAGELLLGGRISRSSCSRSTGSSSSSSSRRPRRLEHAAAPHRLAVRDGRSASSSEGEAGARRRQPVAASFPLIFERSSAAYPQRPAGSDAALRPLRRRNAGLQLDAPLRKRDRGLLLLLLARRG